ncbi:hypothetical protein [Sandaracinus amylolyticus]|uniref:hypothetical protein n=1 Tax=Sandaracinus amylolyticus TaxID=927083 RepID=UPI001F2C81E9|nr:hypothetical protein [Sandaracinus amylolyticus]UJR85658.1 Hypothetical protein I5071_77380 [Sandaracinus amylolyticus]
MRGPAALALAILLTTTTAHARDLFESDDGEFRLVLRSSLKGSWLLAFPADDPTIDEEPGGAALFRLRFELGARLGEYLSAQVAYEHRALAASSTGIGFGLLPSAATPPFRLAALDWAIVDDAPSYAHRHELDRAFVSVHLPFLELTVGRQAIGLGRGVMFSAVDLFAPFAPAEIDREWRRGVDAVHAELRIPEISTLSGDLIAVFGSVENGELESWSLIGRLRATVGDVDGELLVGRRGEDTFVGGALSATIGDAEAHGELAFFGTDGRGVDGGLAGTRGVVMKALIGGSYVIDVWRGLRVALEYHYSGFGIEDIGARPDILADPAFQARFLRGDSQILGRHAIALALNTELTDELAVGTSWLQSPVDGSGMVLTSFTWIASDMLTLLLNGSVPFGTAPIAGIPQSEWGSSAITVFLGARIYD